MPKTEAQRERRRRQRARQRERKLDAARTPRALTCPSCQRPAAALTGAELFPHLPAIARKGFYVCRPCDARVGCHPDGWVPMGSLATPELRRLRERAHVLFDPLWKRLTLQGVPKKEARGRAYAWLSRETGIPVEACHVGMMTEEQCRKVIALCEPWAKGSAHGKDPRSGIGSGASRALGAGPLRGGQAPWAEPASECA